MNTAEPPSPTTQPPFHPVGHLINRTEANGPEGVPGTGYNYIVAANGILIRAENSHIEATALYAPAPVRGLYPLAPTLTLKHGPISPAHLQSIIRAMRLAAPSELMAAIVHDPRTGYALQYPPQTTGPTHVKYESLPNTVLEIHSHADGAARFSRIDDDDEQGLALYGVAGTISERPTISLRIGVYGHFQAVAVKDVFENSP